MSVDYEFDAFNNLLRQMTRQDIGHDGVVDRLEDYRASYDARLNREGVVSETDADVDGTIDTRYNYVADYDSRNRLISQRMEWDEPADGIVDSLETWSIAYDAGVLVRWKSMSETPTPMAFWTTVSGIAGTTMAAAPYARSTYCRNPTSMQSEC